MTRSKMVKVRVTEAEYADWKTRAEKAGFSVSDAIRGRMAAKSLTASSSGDRQLEAFKYGMAVSDPKPVITGFDGTHWIRSAKPAEGLTEAQKGIPVVIKREWQNYPEHPTLSGAFFGDLVDKIVHEPANPYLPKRDEKGRRSEVCIHRMPAHVYCKACDK